MKISCDEATKICDKNQYEEGSLWEKIKLNIHIFLCKKCDLYSKQKPVISQHQDELILYPFFQNISVFRLKAV